jgi:hypothetical protein
MRGPRRRRSARGGFASPAAISVRWKVAPARLRGLPTMASLLSLTRDASSTHGGPSPHPHLQRLSKALSYDLGLPDRRLRVRRERERAAAGGEGIPRADAGEGPPLRPGRLRAQQLEPAPVDVDAPARAARPLPDDFPAPHHRALRRGRGRRLAGLRQHPPVPGDGFFESPSWRHLADWKARARARLPARAPDAGRDAVPRTSPTRRGHGRAGARPGAGGRAPSHRRRRVLRRAGGHGARPVLRRRGAGAHGVHRVRRVHAGVPLRGQEHAGPQLPASRREARPARSSRSTRWSGSARWTAATRWTVLGGPVRWWRPRGARDLPRAQRGAGGRGAGHGAAAAAAEGLGARAAAPLRAAGRVRAHQQRGADGDRERAPRPRHVRGDRHHLHPEDRRALHAGAGALPRRAPASSAC